MSFLKKLYHSFFGCHFILTFLVSFSYSNAKVFYISNLGKNSNDGLSSSKPWRTLDRIERGNTYLFNRGDTFFFPIEKVENPSNDRIVISSYGIGPKPIISLYSKVKKEAWVYLRNNIWKISLSDSSMYSGFFRQTISNIGFIKVEEKIFGYKFSNLTSLRAQWDFFSDNNSLFVYSEIDLSKSALNVQLASRNCIITLSDNINISNLKLVGCGGHGIRGSKVKNIVLREIEVSEIGGSFLPGYGDGTVRYGNGIEFWNGSENCIIKKCSISDVYDAAFTMQGEGSGASFYNIKFYKNISNFSEQSFEFWLRGGKSGFRHCGFYKNKCFNAGYGWSHDVRPDKNSGVHLLTYIWDVNSADLQIRNNLFVNPKNGYMFLPKGKPGINLFKSFENVIFLKSGTPIVSRDESDIAYNEECFKAKTGLEVKTKFKKLNSK